MGADGEIDSEREAYDRSNSFVTTSNKQRNLLFYAIAGPGAWSWQALWRRDAAWPKAPAKKKPRAKPAASRPPKDQEEPTAAA